MSLFVNSNPGASFEPIPAGVHAAICCTLVDLGTQYNETFKNSSRKVLIGWEIPDETYEYDGEVKPRTITQKYTASLNEKSNLRKDLAAWRGRDFTQDELARFDLRNIVGKACLLNIIHREQNGTVYANIASITPMPRGMAAVELSAAPLVFDLDNATDQDIDLLPKRYAEIIRESEEYKQRKSIQPPVMIPLDDEEDLPF